MYTPEARHSGQKIVKKKFIFAEPCPTQPNGLTPKINPLAL